MNTTVTVRLGEDLERMLQKASHASGRSRSDLVRDALRRQLVLQTYEQIRQKVMPHAAKKGFLTDEDVFRKVS